MKIKKLFIVPFLALIASGCSEEEQVTSSFAPGEEVKFGAALENTLTRTIYGQENEVGFPIYWVDGDEVIVSSPECANNDGVGSAHYKVSARTTTQNYADDLIKTGEIGVRWGENPTGNFYSVYPAENATLESDNKTVILDMPYQQDCTIETDANGKKIVRSDMTSCFMYASEKGVTNGQPVNLRYVPLSTAIRFTLTAGSEETTISSITLKAPEGTSITGKFRADLSTADDATLPTMSVEQGDNEIQINASDPETHGYLTLDPNESIEMNAFLFLTEETDVTNEWSIEIVANNVRYTKNLGALANGNTTLLPGKIHRLPKLPVLDATGDWDPSNWMTNIPRNVYLSEISIPGSWNSLNPDFQGRNPSISAQYDAGARAFHIDTRWKGSYNIITGYRISGLGVADGSGTDRPAWNPGNDMVMDSEAANFSDALDDIIERLQPDEYMIVLCTFAQNSYDYNRSNGGWEKAISDICANNEKVIDAKTLTTNTVVGDVLNHVIVIVNTENDINIPDSKCLFMHNMGMTLVQNEYRNSPYTKTTLQSGSNVTIFNAFGTHAQVTYQTDGEQGRDVGARGYAPTLTERETKAGNILNWSKTNYADVANYAHDTWLYLGLGGNLVDSDGDETGNSYTTVASTLNGWINGKVTEMDNNGYYPVGIVLMNSVTTYSTVMNNILQLNNKYRKAYNPDLSPVDGKPLGGSSTGNSMQSAAPGYNSGMTDNGTNAIGWTRVR